MTAFQKDDDDRQSQCVAGQILVGSVPVGSIVLSGHVHQESWREWHSIQFYSTPSTSVQFKPLSDHFALDEQAPGYRILQLNADGSHETHVERVLHAQQKINVEISGY